MGLFLLQLKRKIFGEMAYSLKTIYHVFPFIAIIQC